MKDVTRFEIAKLQLHAGDTLVVKAALTLSREQTAHIETLFAPFVPEGCKIMVLGADLALSVLAKP